MSDALTHALSNRVLTVSFNRPAKKNALTLAMYDGLAEQLQRADDDPQIRAVLLRGEGEVFTAGNDLGDFMKNPPSSMDSPVGRVLALLPVLKTPLIAAVDGVAIGLGTTLLLHCDFAYCSNRAKFKMPFVPLGLCPEAGSTFLLPRLAGRVRASELLLLGESFSAETAHQLGLVSAVVEPDALEQTARTVAEKVARLPPASVRLTKRLILESQAELLQAAMQRENGEFLSRLRSPEAAEAMQAFFLKRAPDFSKFE